MKKNFILMYELEINIANNNSIKFICQKKDDPIESYCLIMTFNEFVHFHSVFENENSINDIYNKITNNKIIMKKNNKYIILEISIENTTLQFELKYTNNNNNHFSYIRIFNPKNAINFLNKYKILFIIAVLVLDNIGKYCIG